MTFLDRRFLAGGGGIETTGSVRAVAEIDMIGAVGAAAATIDPTGAVGAERFACTSFLPSSSSSSTIRIIVLSSTSSSILTVAS